MAAHSSSTRNAAIIARANAGEQFSDIARDFGITRERVRQIAMRGGVKPGMDRIRQNADALLREIIRLDERGLTPKQIAGELGVSATYVYTSARNGGVKLSSKSISRIAAEAKFAAAVKSGMSILAAERVAGLGKGQGRASRPGIQSKHGRWRDLSARKALVERMRREGATWAEVTDAVSATEGRSFASISTWAQSNCDLVDIPRPKRAPKPPRSPKPGREAVHVPSAGSVAETCLAYRGKATAREIADMLGISRNSVIGHWYRSRNRDGATQ